MSHIDELIAELCPGGVPFVSLGELEDQGIIKLGRGKVISKKTLEENPGPYPVYSSSGLGTGEFGRYAEFMFDSEQITWSVDGGGRFFYRTAHKYSVTNVSGWMEVLDNSSIITKYLFHVLDSAWQTKTFDYVHKAHPSVIRVEYSIALPPLEVQRAIVEVLDTFSKLEAELEAELEARKQQYEHYRREVLSFSKDTLWGQLSDFVEYTNGKAHERLADPEGNVAMVTARFISRNGEANRFLNLKDVLTPALAGDVALVLSDLPNGRALARTFYVDRDDSYAINQRVARLRVKNQDTTDPKFVHYFLDRNIGLLRYDNGFDQTHLSKSQVTELPFPIIPLPEQKNIVAILEKFDAIVNDLSIGLPAELVARRQQYEYYRDKLLTFKEL